MESDGAFDSYSSVFKTSWSYAGNFNLGDAGRFTETAGSSWITWTDNSSDSTRGNITALAIAPNTGGSAGKVFIYNDQGSGYAPGWREVWTSTSDGAGSGLDADLWDGNQFASYLNQAVRTTDSPTFGGLTLNGTLVLGSNSINDVEDIYLRDRIYHDGDTNTYIQFHATDQWRVVTGGSERLEVNNSAVTVNHTLDVTGRITPDTPADYDQTAVTSLTNAPIYYDEVNVGTSNTFLPAFHMRSRYSSGYRTHMNVGLYKKASSWGDNDTGFYVALGGNDSYPTKHWKLTYGHSIYNSEGYVSTPGSFRAPIFYDLNNTARYVDPAGTSEMLNINMT